MTHTHTHTHTHTGEHPVNVAPHLFSLQRNQRHPRLEQAHLPCAPLCHQQRPVHVYVCMCVCVFVWCVCTHSHLYTCVCVCVCVCVSGNHNDLSARGMSRGSFFRLLRARTARGRSSVATRRRGAARSMICPLASPPFAVVSMGSSGGLDRWCPGIVEVVDFHVLRHCRRTGHVDGARLAEILNSQCPNTSS